jgi:hypothetical protein
MTQIEAIAERVKPSETSKFYKDTQQKIFIEPLTAKIRDIDNLNEREKAIRQIIESEKGKEGKEVINKKPSLMVIINGKETAIKLPKKYIGRANGKLISELTTEQKKIEDLKHLEAIFKELKDLKGEAEKSLFLEYAKEGQSQKEYKRPVFYTETEFLQIVESMVKDSESEPKTAAPAGFITKKIEWKGTAAELFSLFSDLLEFQLIESEKANLARIICANFKDKAGKDFEFSNVETKLNAKERSKKRADFSKWL